LISGATKEGGGGGGSLYSKLLTKARKEGTASSNVCDGLIQVVWVLIINL
jgi:hypothetical protein